MNTDFASLFSLASLRVHCLNRHPETVLVFVLEIIVLVLFHVVLVVELVDSELPFGEHSVENGVLEIDSGFSDDIIGLEEVSVVQLQ